MVALLAAFSSRRPDVAIQTAHKTYSGREEHCLQRFNKRLQRPELGWNDRVDCKVKRIHSANRYKLRAECEAVDIARKRLVEGCATLICIASMTIGAHAALAEPPMPAAITEVSYRSAQRSVEETGFKCRDYLQPVCFLQGFDLFLYISSTISPCYQLDHGSPGFPDHH